VLFEYRYFGSSTVTSTSAATGLSFAPDTSRAPTFLRAELRQGLAFRECMSALHDVVVSDLRFKPKDRTAYFAWRSAQDELDWVVAATAQRESKAQLDAAMAELAQLRAKRDGRWGAFGAAKRRFFDWLYRRSLDAWFVLDPVVTVHPDEVSFECFSQDESSYGRLACSHEVFRHLGEVACGTTNVDYSQALYDEFQKIRDYKSTSLVVDPGGFEVKTGADDAFREVKIDLPDSWMRGFLQVGAAMTLPGAVRLRLHPMDVHNLCLHLRRRREKQGPRSLRFLLEPGRPIRVRIEPFDIVLECPRSVHTGPAAEIRVWGRRRLLTLERLVPVARHFDVVLLGSGMPSFWLADCGDLTYTLGLSGWTANDWSKAGNFDLLAPRGAVDPAAVEAVWAALSRDWRASTEGLSAAVGRDRGTVEAVMLQLAQAGRAMYDLRHGVWRKRELTREPLDLGGLRFSNEREEAASRLAFAKGVAVGAWPMPDGSVRLQGRAGGQACSLVLDADQRLRSGECGCSFYFRNRLKQGPCEHLLALRLAHDRRLGEILPPTPPPTPPPAPAEPPPAPRGFQPRVVRRSTPEERGFPTRSVHTHAVDASEPGRLADLLIDTGVVELVGDRRPFEADLRTILAGSKDAAVRARALWRVLESRDYVAEFYAEALDDLVTLFQEWG
jgi:hypothetical protein